MEKAPDLLPNNDYEYIHAGTVIYDKMHKILLVHQTNGIWSLPKGSVKFGESIYQGALRETHEETGIDLSPYTPVGIEQYRLFGTSDYTLFIFKLPISFKELDIAAEKNSIATEWFDNGDYILKNHKVNKLTVAYIRNYNNYARTYTLRHKLSKDELNLLETLKKPLTIPLRGGNKTRRRRGVLQRKTRRQCITRRTKRL